MRSPTRRNRNIGTAKSGYKKQSKFDRSDKTIREHWEKAPVIEKRMLGDIEVTFFIDELREGYHHPCMPNEVIKVLSMLPEEDTDMIEHVYFHQPTKRDEIFRSSWAAIYYFAGPDSAPLLVLKAQPKDLVLKWKLSVRPWEQEEVERLKEYSDYRMDKRHHVFKLSDEQVRMWQLAQSVPHEIGHWVDFFLDIPDNFEQNEQRANHYADRWAPAIREALEEKVNVW